MFFTTLALFFNESPAKLDFLISFVCKLVRGMSRVSMRMELAFVGAKGGNGYHVVGRKS